MGKTKLDLVILASIYVVAFNIVLWYGLNNPPVNDGMREYNALIANYNEGWKLRPTLVNSCLMTTYLPVLIQKTVGGDLMFIFRLIPALFYPLMPCFAYLIARRYLVISRAVIAMLVVLLSSYFIYFPDMGRVGVALAFMAGMIWALLERRMIWAVVFSVLLVFSHYGTVSIAVALVGATVLVTYIKSRVLVKHYLVCICLLVALTGVWHFGISGFSGHYIFHTLVTPDYGNSGDSFFDVTTREYQVQAALLVNFNGMPIPEKLEIAFYWLVVLIITIGLYFTVREKSIDSKFKMMSLLFYGGILTTIALPWMSMNYGAIRVYFSSTILLATCFPIGVERIARKLHIPFLVLALVVLVLYALSTSGIIFEFFGLHKYMPVLPVELVPKV